MRIKAKKRLGQNFLSDKNIRAKIVASCDFKPGDIVVEIGPGRGALTQLIAPRVGRLIAVEVDRDLCGILRSSLAELPNIEIINRDVLKFDFREIIRAPHNKIKVIGNIPYYISTPIIEHLFVFRSCIEAVFLTVQKEFGQRLVAPPGSKTYGSLSCYVQYYTRPEIIFSISRQCFTPTPKVDSVVVRLSVCAKSRLLPGEEKLLFKIIRAAFSQRRKTLRNSLDGVVSSNALARFFALSDIVPNIRPDDIALRDFMNLARIEFNGRRRRK